MPVVPDGVDTSGWSCSSANIRNSNEDLPSRVGNPAGDFVVELVMSNSGDVTISTCNPGSNYDTYLHIYSDNDHLSDQLADDDDSCGSGTLGHGNKAQIETFLDVGTYYVVVEGYGGNEGNFELSITCPDVTGK